MPNINTNFFHVDKSSSSESDEDETDTLDSWSHVIIKSSRREFNDNNSGLNMQLLSGCKTLLEYYKLLFYDEMMDFLVEETNRYGTTKDVYIPTGNIEMRKFLALITLIGYVHLPNLEDYWSTDPTIDIISRFFP